MLLNTKLKLSSMWSTMKYHCMVCGDRLDAVRCIGKIKGMSVSFCGEHAAFCENCETITCKIIKKSN